MNGVPQTAERVLPSAGKRARTADATVSAWTVFVQAATQPSLGAVAGAAGVTLLLFAACLVLITPRFMADRPGYVAQGPTDDYAFVSAQAIRTRLATDDAPAVALFGASALRESISHDSQIRESVATRLGGRVAVHNLTTSAQTVWETAALTDYLAKPFEGVVVLGVSPYLLSAGRGELAELVEQPRLALHAASFDDEARRAGLRVPRSTGNYFVDNDKFFLARIPKLVLHFVTGPVARAHGRYLNKKPLTAAGWDDMAEKIKDKLDGYGDNVEGNLAVMGRTIDRLRSRGRVSVALVELPTSPRGMETIVGAPLGQQHRERVTAFARQHGVEYWSLDRAADLADRDFFDWCHLSSVDAQRRFTDVLSAKISQALASQRAMAAAR
jgi:hypothetical protein